MSKKCACLKVLTSRTCIHFIVITESTASTKILVVLQLLSFTQVCTTWTTYIYKLRIVIFDGVKFVLFFLRRKILIKISERNSYSCNNHDSIMHIHYWRNTLKECNLWICNEGSIKVLVLFRFTLIIIFASASLVHRDRDFRVNLTCVSYEINNCVCVKVKGWIHEVKKTGAVLNDLETFYEENLIIIENKWKNTCICQSLESIVA